MSRLLKRRLALLAEKQERYRTSDRAEIEAFQSRRLTQIWSYCVREVPFYRRWAREHGLPANIHHPSDLAQFPVLTKKLLVDRRDEVFAGLSPKAFVSTGGSTGEPARYPATPACLEPGWANAYLGRGWWGIRPFQRHVHIWGHAHLFGAGWRGRVAQVKRRALDAMMNATRLNAYDMSPDAIDRYARIIAATDPVTIIGYTSAVFRLARHVLATPELELSRTLKGVIITSESSSGTDIAVIEEAFRAPVIQEYGSAETGVLAYSHPDTGQMHMFWDSFAALRSAEGDLRVTTLNRRVFPLINYTLGDVAETDTPPGESVLSLRRVQGRTQDAVMLGGTDGSVKILSAILLVHILKLYPGVRSVAFEQHSERFLGIFVEADRPLDLGSINAFFADEIVKMDFPRFDPGSVTFVQVEEQQRTLSGKHRLIRTSS